jgi:hypothetical protein
LFAWPAPPEGRVPFALVAASAGAGATLGAGAALGSAAALADARPAFGPAGGPELAVPLAMDASGLDGGAPKLWLAIARAAATSGCAVVVTPDQLAARGEVLRAARVPTVLAVAPGRAVAPAGARAASAILLPLGGPDGVPALLDAAALPGWVEACRALGAYKVPVAVSIPPGRRPPWWALSESHASGLSAICFEPGAGASREPLAARLGRAAQAAAASSGLACLLGDAGPPDGETLCVLLAAGARTVVTAGPVEAAAREEGASAGDWKALGDQLSRAVGAVWDDARRTARSVGCADPRDLARDNLRARTYDAAALSGARLAGYDERLPWWVH